jgi:hypothetical protein
MRYQNVSGGSLLLPREDGRGGSLDIPKDKFFQGSSMYQKYVESGFVRRVGQGSLYPPVEAADPAVVILGKHLVENGLVAEAIDQSAYPDAVTSTTAYTVFGKVFWYDEDGDLVDEVDFSVVGNGTHGSGSTFVYGSSAASTKPVAAGSSIDISNGQVSIKFNSGAPEGDVVVEAAFDYRYAGEHLHYGDVGDAIFNTPNTTTRTIHVTASDVSSNASNYVTGSDGQVKFIRSFARGAQVGDRLKLTTFRYRDTNNPTEATNIDVSDDTVIAADLA